MVLNIKLLAMFLGSDLWVVVAGVLSGPFLVRCCFSGVCKGFVGSRGAAVGLRLN